MLRKHLGISVSVVASLYCASGGPLGTPGGLTRQVSGELKPCGSFLWASSGGLPEGFFAMA